MKNEHYTMSNIITFGSTLALLIIDSPFIFFIKKFGLNSKILPLFIASLMLYNQIILPIIISKILSKFSNKLTLDDVYLVEKELKKQIDEESKNDNEKGNKQDG